MSKALFLGDEAVAQAALDAGLSGVYAYPGTPSTEITEFIQNSKQGKAGEVHTRQFSTWRAVNLLQIAYFVCFKPLLEDIRVRLVADGQEETVNLDIYLLLVGFTFALDQMGTFYTIFSIETKRVVLKQNLNVLALHHTLLHAPCCADRRKSLERRPPTGRRP